MLSISHYTKTYPGGKTAVDDLTLHVAPGEICGFIGRNGAGKTTTLRAVAGVMRFTQGTITIAGRDIRTDPVGAKAVTAFLPDNPDLYEFMSGIEYLNLIADLYDIPAQQREERVGLYAGAFQLTAELGSAIASYSHGMKQKLALISALIRKPKLLVLDEPFVGLDPAAAHLLKGYLRELCEAGGAVFFSTHVLEVAEKLCSTIAIIQDGRLVRHGPTEEVVGDSSLESVFLGLAEKGAEA
ncbi:MAG: ABC transporter ATP-binding protein [Oscillospiraceae bacterium]|nr:ABC transporter ATP-binding protein [Oscillospiraceae bacterium]